MFAVCRPSAARLCVTITLALCACSGPARVDEPDAGTVTAPDAGTVTHPDGGSTPDGGTIAPDGGTPDTCGFNHFNHAVGFACNRDADCASGLCYRETDPYGDPGRAYCTEPCDTSAPDCPATFDCQDIATGSAACVAAADGKLLPGDHTLKLGEPCSGSVDCIGGSVCAQASNPDGTNSTFCAPPCEAGVTGSCGDCGNCEAFGSDPAKPDYFCTPKGPKQIGAACDSHYDCGSFVCVGFCTQGCSATGTACPSGSSCEPISDTTSICITPAQKGQTAPGGACVFDLECAQSAKCHPAPSGTGSVCTIPARQDAPCSTSTDCATGLRCLASAASGDRTCQPPGDVGATCAAVADCATGLSCRDISIDLTVCTKDCVAGCGTGNACGVVDLDTMLRLYSSDAAGAAFIARNDDIDYDAGNAWSSIVGQTLQPGVYWVSVETFKEFVGSYKLELVVAGQAPTALFELPENPVRNDTAANAQELTAFPATVTGTIDTKTDVDFYKFTVPGSAAVTVTLKVGPGAPSACLPTAQLGQTAIGQTCNFNGYCASALCEFGLKACGKACAVDGDCGQGFSCADLGSHKTCVSSASVGQKARNAACAHDYECADRYCAAFKGDHFCTPRCESAAVSCGVGNECAELNVTRAGATAPVVERACVPEGDHTAAFNATCLLLSDCQPDLLCTGGRCAKQCSHDTDCPDQNFPVAATAPSLACQACTSYTECGSGNCVQGVGFEQFCVDACDASGKCPAGFSCQPDLFGDFCLPQHGSCRRPVCQVPAGQAAGLCAVPPSAFAELCAVAGDCLTNSCAGGLCSKTCTRDADCGCSTGDLICKQGLCQKGPSSSEVEPNDTPAQAQPLTGNLPFRLFATLEARGAVRDTDDYSLGLSQGDTVHVITRPMCGTGAPSLDTAVTLYLAGTKVAEDSYDNYGTLRFTATATGTYLIEVKDGSFGPPRTGMYVLEVTK